MGEESGKGGVDHIMSQRLVCKPSLIPLFSKLLSYPQLSWWPLIQRFFFLVCFSSIIQHFILFFPHNNIVWDSIVILFFLQEISFPELFEGIGKDNISFFTALRFHVLLFSWSVKNMALFWWDPFVLSPSLIFMETFPFLCCHHPCFSYFRFYSQQCLLIVGLSWLFLRVHRV